MSTGLRVHRVKEKGKEVIRRYRLIPYEELAAVLRADDEAFLENGEGEYKLKRGTIWRAARRLSEMIGKPVRAERAFLRFEDGTVIEGYSFFVAGKEAGVERQSRRR
jgi:hypothetical protein